MADYNFEYTDTKFTLKLLGISFLTFILLLIAMIVTIDLIGVIGGLILAFGVPLLIFFLNKKKILKQGSAIINDSYSEFKLSDTTNKIVYSDIRTYQVERFNGTHLKIKFKDGSRFKLQANSNFCNSKQFDLCSQEFDDTVQRFKTTNGVELTRKKSIFEQAWMLPLLIILTGGLLGGVLYAIIQGKRIPPTFYTSGAIVIPLWVAFFNARKRKKDQGS